MHKLNYCFQKVDGAHKIFLYDNIEKYGAFNWETWKYDDSETSAKHFRELLDEIPQDGEIELHINSNGGDVAEGTTIYNLLRQHGAKKTGIVDGVCHSIAFTILQACDTRIAGDGTSMIIHNMWRTVSGNANELRKAADNLDALMESCIQLYLKRGNVEEGKLREMLDAETVLTPQSALEYGFIDKIGAEPEDGMEARLQQLMEENKNLRQQMRESTRMKTQFDLFLQEIKKEIAPAQKEKLTGKESTGFSAFFNGVKGEKNEN